MVKATSEAVDVTLALVARGNAILAEIERLSDIIPLLFRSDTRLLNNSSKKMPRARPYLFEHLSRVLRGNLTS